jgi:multidrug efflux system outer membrane protein
MQAKAYDRSRFESIWWKQFDDPVLNQLVQASLDGNRDLRVAFARLKSARAIREDAANDQLPVVTSRASSEIGKGQVPGQTEQRVNSERYDLGLDMAWELDLFGRIQRQIEASEAQEAAAAADLQQLQVSLIAELVDAYGQLRGAQLRENIALANLKTQQESRTITETLRDAGVGNDLDVVRADARLAGVEATVPQLQAEQARARHRIATLLGQRPDALSVDLSPKALPAIAKALPVGDPGELLRRCGHCRPVPTGQPQWLPRLYGCAWLADRLLGSQRLGPRPEHHLGGLRPGQRARPSAWCQGRRRRRPGQL